MKKNRDQLSNESIDISSDVVLLDNLTDSDMLDEVEILEATHLGELKIGDAILGCAVLEDGTRLLTQTSFMQAIGRKGSPRKRTSFVKDEMPEFLSASNLAPFIDDELRKSWIPVAFKIKGRAGRPGYGYRADLLPQVCNVYLDVSEAGQLHPNQVNILRQCRILSRGFSTVGIVALIDEATGYQEVRDRNALHKILEAYIAKELLPWAKRFPDEFYKEMFRLRGWQYSPMSTKGPLGPRYAAKLTNEIVYDRLPPGVLDELRRKNPIEDGRRKHKHHQFLTEDIGNPHLEKHLAVVTALMRASTTWDNFKRLLARAVPKSNENVQQGLWAEDEDEGAESN